MELLLPVALKLFPGFLPSTFTTSSQRDQKMHRTLKAKLEYARFLQKTLDEMSVQTSQDRSSKSAKDFVDFFTRVKDGRDIVTHDEIMKFSKFFEDEITLDNMTRGQLVAICRLLELTPIGNSNFLRFQIEMKLRQLKTDDEVIKAEGLDNLTVTELQTACKERGMRALGMSEETLKKQLFEWLALSLNAKVPPSLLLLSRTLYLPDALDTTSQIAATISVLPESAATQTKATIGEREGKIENITRLEVIREEQRRIEKENKETTVAEDGEADDSDKVVKEGVHSVKEATVSQAGEVEEKKPMVPPSPVTEVLKEATSKAGGALSSEDFVDLKKAIKTLNKTEDLEDQQDRLGDIKKELEDYQEDIQDLSEVKPEDMDLQESKAAKRLYGKINNMVKQADVVLSNLHKQEKKFSRSKAEQEDPEKRKMEEEHLVSVQELINSVQTIQKTLDDSKLDQISKILSQIDIDADGVINIEHVSKVIELLGPDQLNLSDRQIHQIVDMLEKEEMLEIGDKMKKVLLNPDKSVVDKDIAKDLTIQEAEPHIKEMFENKGNSNKIN